MTIAIKTYCRICPAFCGLEVDLDGDKIAAVRGDPDNPLSRGYICIKGRVNGEFHQGPDRLRESLARGDDGRLRPIAVGTAMDEISARLREIVAEDGPRAVAVYVGTQGLTPTLGDPLARSFIAALESPCLFSTMTIDQSAKWIAPARMGTFGGGPQSFEDADVWLLCGTNPLVSVQATLPFELAGLFFHDAEAGVKLLTGGADFTNMEALQDFLVRNARQLGTAGKILFPIPNRRLSKRLYRMTAKCLVIWGREDKFIDPVYAERFCELLPDAELRLVGAAGHMVPNEEPETVAKAILDFAG